MGAASCRCEGCRKVDAAAREKAAARSVDWGLMVVPDGAFLVLTSERQVTPDQVTAFKQAVPAGLRDRVLIVSGVQLAATGEKVNTMWGFA